MIVANKARREVVAIVHDLVGLTSGGKAEEMLSAIGKTSQKLAQVNPGHYRVLREEIAANLRAGLTSTEGLGFGLPLVLLGAVGTASESASSVVSQKASSPSKAEPATPSRAQRKPRPKSNYAGAGTLKIVIDEDLMDATINEFDLALYDDPEVELNEQWIRNEIASYDIVHGVREEFIAKILDALSKTEALDGCRREGFRRARSSQTLPLPLYKDTPKDAKEEEDSVDMRDLQQRNIVHGGQQVAEVRYEISPKPGKNILGEPIPPPEDEEFIPRVGDGIDEREPGKFYATSDGTPKIDDAKISLICDLVHTGDVNLTTGNIYFDGPAVIEGYIDNGAVVDVTGDLTVRGGIRGAFVRCGGSITVEGPIVMGGKGRIQARGDISAEFIEHARVICGGALNVEKTILSSEIIAGSTIEVNGDLGVVSGGTVSCREYLKCANLGMTRGSLTTLNIGVDWRSELSVQIRRKRIEAIKEISEKARQELRQLVRRSKAQMTARHQEMKEGLQKKLQKARTTLENAQEHFNKAKSMLSFDPDARIYVQGLLSANVAIMVGGKNVKVDMDVGSVVVTAKRQAGSHISPLEEFVARERREERVA